MADITAQELDRRRLQVGKDFTLEEGYQCARTCGLNILAQVSFQRAQLGVFLFVTNSLLDFLQACVRVCVRACVRVACST